MESDQLKWDERYLSKPYDQAPDSFLIRHLHEIQGNTILDLAGGHGRNALFLAEKGYKLTVADISSVGLNRLKNKATEKSLSIGTLLIDLDNPHHLQSQFDTVICINFRPKESLLKHIPSLLNPNGVFLWSSFNDLQAKLSCFPIEKALKPAEFKSFFTTLQLLQYERFEDLTGLRDAYLFTKKH